MNANGYDGIGRPEHISGDLLAYWSCRIYETNRIVNRIKGNVMKIVQCCPHYGAK
ncbi:MAG: type II toxin-antitoxin system YoeB family toxin [Clostridiales bacterium]|nr:type II toxin-antitoxin system YoeB family toxin [Clostridiales bacterium]